MKFSKSFEALLIGLVILVGWANSAFAAGNTLSNGSLAYSTSTYKFGTAARSNGYAYTASPVVTTSTTAFRFEAWINTTTTPSAIAVVVGQVGTGYLGVDTSGHAICSYNNTAVNLTSTVSVTDGNWHFMRMDASSTGGACYVDGALVSSSATAFNDANSTADLNVGDFNGGGGNGFTGYVDEVAVFNNVTATTAVPTSAYTGSETGELALYHLDSSSADSSSGSTTTYAPNSASIYYSPACWLVTPVQAKTNCSGAYFKTAFTGNQITLNFNLANTSAPYDTYTVVVDNEIVARNIALSAATYAVTMPSDTAAWPHHTLEVDLTSTPQALDRWNTPVTAMQFAGLTVASSSTLETPKIQPKAVVCIGDSITEGYNTLASAVEDATLGWCFRLRQTMGVEVGVIGFARQGFGVTGVGNVPVVTSTYNYLWSGQARTSFLGQFGATPTGTIDLVTINECTNDVSGNGSSTAACTSGLPTLISGLQGLLAATTKINVQRPFNGNGWAQLQAAEATVSAPQISLTDTTGFFDATESYDGLHPYGSANINTIGPLLSAQLLPVINPASSENFHYGFH